MRFKKCQGAFMNLPAHPWLKGVKRHFPVNTTKSADAVNQQFCLTFQIAGFYVETYASGIYWAQLFFNLL